MDKEAQEKIAHIELADHEGITVDGVPDYIRCGAIGLDKVEQAIEFADQILQELEQLGYRKPLDRPKLRENIAAILWRSEIKSRHEKVNQILALYELPKEKPKKDKPPIVCLCGSTRFVDTFNEWRRKLTLEGKIVVSIELVLPQSEREDPQHSNYEVKQRLDELHLRKIDIADEVMILNVGGYIGESTRKELEYAEKHCKKITYLERPKGIRY